MTLADLTILNLWLKHVGSKTAVSFTTPLVAFVVWVVASMPVALTCGWVAHKHGDLVLDVATPETDAIPHVIPDAHRRWYSTPPFSYLLGGIMPFVCVSMELSRYMRSLWLHQHHLVADAPDVTMALLFCLTCAQVSILLTFVQFQRGDPYWWWNSFWNCASVGLYFWAYGEWFLVTRLNWVGLVPTVVYGTYMTLTSIYVGLFCGSIGFLSTLWFNRWLYGSTKVVTKTH